MDTDRRVAPRSQTVLVRRAAGWRIVRSGGVIESTMMPLNPACPSYISPAPDTVSRVLAEARQNVLTFLCNSPAARMADDLACASNKAVTIPTTRPAMIDVRIVCAHDAVETAKKITRLLEAEGHAVRLSFGRHALAPAADAPSGAAPIGAAKGAAESAEAVIVIWSVNGASAHYLLHAAMQTPAPRLIEIARAPGWPSLDHRRQQPIDFTRWNGARGGLELRNPWRELEERLRAVSRACEPQKAQPVRAAMAMGAAGMVALGAAAVMRVGEEMRVTPELEDQRASYASVEEVVADARGGPLHAAIEPFSAPDEDAFGPYARRVRMLDATASPTAPELAPTAELAEPEDFREQSFFAFLSGDRRSEP